MCAHKCGVRYDMTHTAYDFELRVGQSGGCALRVADREQRIVAAVDDQRGHFDGFTTVSPVAACRRRRNLTGRGIRVCLQNVSAASAAYSIQDQIRRPDHLAKAGARDI